MLFFELVFFATILIPLLLIAFFAKAVGWRIVFAILGIPFSIIFLLASGVLGLVILLASIAVNYFLAVWLQRTRSKAVLLTGVAADLAVLAYFKYSVFIENEVLGFEVIPAWRLALPLGISFYTFSRSRS